VSPVAATIAAMADALDISLADQLEELGAQLAWVREYL
jgi:hypothetical protein